MSVWNDNNWLERTELLIGKEKLNRLKESHVLIVGLGGVGGGALEFLVRSGIGELTLIDGDVVSPSNRNRQFLALATNHEQPKAEVAKQRALSINPDVKLNVIEKFMLDEDFAQLFNENAVDYIIDAIDTLTPKIYLIKNALEAKIPLVSSMGAGGKTDPRKVEVVDIAKTNNDKLARMLRKRLHKLNIRTGFKAVYSPEEINPNAVILTEGEQNKKSNVGTISYMPPMFGLVCAYTVINDLIQK